MDFAILAILGILAFFVFMIYKVHKQTNINLEFTEDNETKDDNMPKCKICSKETNGYKYCIDCFQKIQQGETETCKLCGEQYIKGTICNCAKTSDNTNGTYEYNQYYSDYTEESENDPPLNIHNNIYQKEEKGAFNKGFGTSMGTGCGCVTFLVLSVIILFILILIFAANLK